MSNSLDNNLLVEIWQDFKDIPIWNWNEVAFNGNLSALIKEGDKAKRIDLEAVWIDLQQQYFDEFGIQPEVNERFRILNKLVTLNKKYIETRDRVLLNFIAIEESKLQSDGVEYKFFEVLDAVEKYKGFNIDPKQYKAIKWFTALKQMSKNNK